MEPAPDKLLATFLRRLTNLSAHNRSLMLLKPTEQFLDLHSLSQLNGEKSFSIVEAMIRQQSLVICPVADSRMESANQSSQQLKKLHRLDQFIYEERGSHDLHVGWPFVRGKFADDTIVRSPLLFFPVQLAQEANRWKLQFRPGGEIVFNKSFLLGYAFYNKQKADEPLLNETFDEVDRDSTAFRTAIYKSLQQSTIELNFNPDNYRDELIDFARFTKADFEASHRTGELKLFPEAVLGIFPQAGSLLVPDYLKLLEDHDRPDLATVFERNQPPRPPVSDNFIGQVREEKMHTIFPADIWQENALKAAKLGYSLVVQGPPGTGKSQLIANLIGDAMAAGKRVLLVCQKRAALDVVYARLQEKNMAPFVALVHDFKNDRPELFEKIAAQINRTDDYKKKNISLDAIQMDRQFLAVSKRIDQLAEELEQFRQSLFDESECGRSIKELYLTSSPQRPFVSLKQEFHHFRFDEADVFVRSLRQYASYASRYEQDHYSWKDRKSFYDFGTGDLAVIKSKIEEVYNFFQEISATLTSQLNAAPDLEQLLKFGEKKTDLMELLQRSGADEVFVAFRRMLPEKSIETNALWLSNMERVLMDCFVDEGPEVSVPSALLGHFQKALHRSMKARRSLWSWLRWQLFSSDKMMITRALVANQLHSDKESFLRLERRLDQRLNFEHNLSKLRNKKWLAGIPDVISKQALADWFVIQQDAIRAKSNFNAVRGLKNLVNPVKLNGPEFRAKIKTFLAVLDRVQHHVGDWSQYLSEGQMTRLCKDGALGRLLIDELQNDFDGLCEFDKLKQQLPVAQLATIEKLKEKTGTYDPDSLVDLFFNSLGLAWIEHIEAKHPELRIPTSGKIQRLEDELQEQIDIKQSLTAEILLLRAREWITSDLEFNRLNNRVSYRDLLHQTTKRKRIWPLRRVISEFEPEVFKLIPCWMASPESVSTIFPMKEIFDLVIFDEASQCFAERGIPALCRGKQAVIAGDNKQLRPADFYLARWQEDDIESPDAEVDSLLELAERYWMMLRLHGHYRSQSLELIDFSNRHFYQGGLQLLPDFHQLNNQTPAIRFDKVEGTWHNNRNNTEAMHIVGLVSGLAATQPEKDIGIVTFNTQQQALIQDRLEEEFAQSGHPIPARLFVKNIENVQGDERDIIIFSVGYAPDDAGNVHAQFGSLNQAGGENRLNVAISRAREKIIIVSSLWPEQLEVSHTKNEGPRLLKEYLKFAQTVSSGQFKPYVREEGKLPFSRQLKHMMNPPPVGLVWAANAFPFFDVAIRTGDAFKGALFTDDDYYFESLSAKAPHALTPQLLHRKNWPYRRVYSRNYWHDPKRFDNEVKGF